MDYRQDEEIVRLLQGFQRGNRKDGFAISIKLSNAGMFLS